MSLSALFPCDPSNEPIPLLPYATRTSTPYQTAPASPNPPSQPSLKMVDPIPQTDALLALSRQEAHLQSTIQSLLDAQSDGLLAGLAGGSAQDEASSTGSRTPTTTGSTYSPTKPRSIIPVRQPLKRKLGLRGARRGIARAMFDLAHLKSEEGRVLDEEVVERDGILSTISAFESKTSGLREHIKKIHVENTSRRVEHLKAEEKTLGASIHDLETQLYEMKARHRHLIREIDGLNNSVQSKLSSYESALAMAEKDIQRYLARPPVESSTKASTGVWALPKERRTLEMAKDYYHEEQRLLRARVEAVQAEGNALEEGKVVWEEVTQEIDTVERTLRQEMQRMQSPPIKTDDNGTTRGMKKILQTMQHVRASVESKLDLAETNNWKLLVCCIGAELEALTEGQAVLEGSLHASTSGVEPYSEAESSRSNGVKAAEGALIDDSAPASSPPGTHSPAHAFLDRSEDEDDGPGPELLISQHE